MLTTFGLTVIGIAWIYQMVRVLRGGTALYAIFLALYVVGMLCMAVDGFMSGATIETYFTIAFGLAALTTLVSLQRHP
jgi:hypothetical protein